VHKALRELLVMCRTPLTFSNDFVRDMLQHMRRVFPQKTDYVGETGLKALINEGIAEAREYKFDTARQTALIVVLKYGFGHGCTNDLLYPWIQRTLRDEKIVEPAGKAARLEKKAVTWLEHVVARNERGTQA